MGLLLLQSLAVALACLLCGTSAWNYGGGHQKIIVKHVPKHVPVYKQVPVPHPVPVPKPVGYLKPLALAKPFRVPHVVPVIKHFQKPFPIMKGVPFHFPIPLPKLVKLPFQIKLPKPYVVRVPKPYAVPKKYPVAVPVHIPKPYVVPILKPYPVGVPHKVPNIIPVVKEVPEYVKKPVPVYVEEKPYKHEHYNPDGNYKGTPYIPGDSSYKGSPFPSGIGGGYKGSPFPSGIGGGYKGSPFPSGIGGGYKGSPFPSSGHKGTPFPSGGNKGTPYFPTGKGGGGGGGGKGGNYHSKGTNVHATSAASFLEAHASKLQHGGGGYGSTLSSYSHDLGSSDTQQGSGSSYGSFGQGSYGHESSYGSFGQELGGGYDLHGLAASIGGYDTAGRGIEGNSVAKEPASDYNADSEESGDDSKHPPKESDNQDNSGYDRPQAYLGVSVTSFDDHSGRGGGYPENANQANYGNSGGDYSGQQQQDSGPSYASQVSSPNYVQLPQIALYQVQNGAATAIHYPNAGGVQFYNAGYQVQNQQEDNSYADNHVTNENQSSQGYQQQQNGNEAVAGQYQYQHTPFGYQGYSNYQGQSYPNIQAYGNLQNQENSGYGNQQDQENAGYRNNQNQGIAGYVNNQNQDDSAYGNNQNQENSGYGNQESQENVGYGNHQNQESTGYGNQESYGSQSSGYQTPAQSYGIQVNTGDYQNQQSYQVGQNSDGYQSQASGYGGQEVAPGLQHYGLRAAYPVQTGEDNQNHPQDAAGAVYVRAYDNQAQNQASYSQENYQSQDSQPQKSYAAYSPQISDSSSEVSKQETPAAGRSYDSSSFSQPEGSDTKGGSWQGVQ